MLHKIQKKKKDIGNNWRIEEREREREREREKTRPKRNETKSIQLVCCHFSSLTLSTLLDSRLDPYGLAAQWITDALNPSVYTYEVAPVFTVLEDQVLREMRRYVGYPNGDGDGLFVPGGSMANTYAMHCARHRALPNFKVISVIERLEQNSSNSSSNKRTDLTESYSILSNPQEEGSFGSPRLVVFTSKDAHYSVKKAAFLLGIGSSNIYLINVDECGRMDPAHLRQEIERAIKENAKPIMVSATAGNFLSLLCHSFSLCLNMKPSFISVIENRLMKP